MVRETQQTRVRYLQFAADFDFWEGKYRTLRQTKYGTCNSQQIPIFGGRGDLVPSTSSYYSGYCRWIDGME